jgi:hypothetical protein
MGRVGELILWGFAGLVVALLLLVLVGWRTEKRDKAAAALVVKTERETARPKAGAFQHLARAERIARGEATPEEVEAYLCQRAAKELVQRQERGYGAFQVSLEEFVEDDLTAEDPAEVRDRSEPSSDGSLQEWARSAVEWERPLWRRIYIEYADAYDEDSEREVDARRLFQRKKRLYLSGYCRLDKAPRTFRVDRIEYMEDRETGEVFDKDEVAAGLGMMSPDEG